MYAWRVGERVVIVSGGAVVREAQVVEVTDHFVVLDDQSRWYRAGLPAAGPGDRRITPLTPAMEAALARRGRLRAIAELATALVELADTPGRVVPDVELEATERHLLSIVTAVSTPAARHALWERINAARTAGVKRPLAG